MIIYPAIDIRNGKCVRLLQGDYDKETIYDDDPVAVAEKWQSKGAEYMHLVDLDGALAGKGINLDVIKKIVNTLSIPCQTGGGIRTMEKVDLLLGDIGIDRVIIGTAAIENPELVAKAVCRYGSSRVAVGIDAKNGYAAIRGWRDTSEIKAVDLALAMKVMGVDIIIYTDIKVDGTLSGPNLIETEYLIENTGMKIIASGGIGSIDDIINVKNTSAEGLIIGKALYTGDVDLQAAINKGKQL